MKREYKDYLNDIYDSIEKIEKFTEHMKFAQFEKDDRTVLAVVKALEITGEAVKKIPPSIRNKYPQIPWKKISGMRDKLVHEYFGINIKVVWRTIKEDIPPIKPLIHDILKNLSK
ncbi:MAG: HepT-like ribonuclease domain-containing protein [Candidatus Helarchaeota archaeon]